MKRPGLDLTGISGRFKKTWSGIIGLKPGISPDNVMVNAVNIITVGVLIFMLIVNLSLRLFSVSVINIVLLLVTSFFYFLSRFKQKYQLSIVLFGAVSYIALVFTYRYNGGINGPTLFIFFLTFQLLISITSRKLHLTWAILHAAVGFALVSFEKVYPGWVLETYSSQNEKFLDVILTYIIVLVFIYFITNHLRNSYKKEKVLAEERASAIEEQNKKLEVLGQEKDKLFSIISHDVRSPLSTIQGYLELLADDALNDNDEYIKKQLLNMTKQTSDMLLNMLAWQKSQMQGVEVKAAAVDLNMIIQKILTLQASIAATKTIEINYEPSKKVVAVADADMVQLITRNIINNAIKFTPVNGSIDISTTTKGNKCFINISDTGIGIPAHKQNEIFKLKAKTTYGTENEKGTGMGLALCKEFIERQHGDIHFTSEPGKGTEFIISLPAFETTLS